MGSKYAILPVLCLSIVFLVSGQEESGRIRMGFNYGRGSQDFLPKKNENYLYETEFFKIQINYFLFRKRKWKFELNLEPGIYFTEHQLLNEYYVQPSRGPDFMELREEFGQLRNFEEYVLNLGFIIRYPVLGRLSTYCLLSVGPMYATEETERMARGFAFSDVLGLGILYKKRKVTFDLRFSLRHVSNAQLLFPNAGHNSAMLESGIAFTL